MGLGQGYLICDHAVNHGMAQYHDNHGLKVFREQGEAAV